MKRLFATVASISMVIGTCPFLEARGRGGGGFSRGGGGMSRPAVHAPSMSRPNVSRPSVPMNRPSYSRPNIPTTRPSMPTTRPSMPTTRPSMPTTRPGMPSTRPNFPNNRPSNPTTRPNLPTTRPGNPSTRPNLPNTRPNLPTTRPSVPGGGQGSRPNFPSNPGVRPSPGVRPNPGDLKDFLDLPGRDPGFSRPTQPKLPETRPSRPETRPNRPENLPDRRPENRPNVNRPNSGNNINRPNIGNGSGNNIGNRIQGGHNINVGNVNVNVRNKNINNVRNRWTNVNNRPFDRNFWVDPGYGRRPAYWRWQTGWGRYPRYWCWRPCTWVAFGTWFTWTWTQPVVYNYGTTVVYRDNYVYVNDKQAGTATQYYQQADTLAESIPETVEPEKVEWMPLGVFAATDPDGNDTSMLLQLAVSKEGIIAGTLYNTITERSRPVEGMVDRETQRAAWQFADDEDSEMVMEAGIYDLTQDETSALLHFDKDNSQNWLLVRLPDPEDEK